MRKTVKMKIMLRKKYRFSIPQSKINKIGKFFAPALKYSPAWHPARSHNREVYATASLLEFASQSYYQ